MYRKPILTEEDMQALVGNLVRLEWNTPSSDYVGIVDRVDDRGVFFTEEIRGGNYLACIQGFNIVFATTADEIRLDEQPHQPERWRNRHNLAVG